MPVEVKATKSYVYLRLSKGSFHTLLYEVNFDTSNLAKDLKLEILNAVDSPSDKAYMTDANNGQLKHYTITGMRKDGSLFNYWVTARDDEGAIAYCMKTYQISPSMIQECVRGWVKPQ